MRQLGVTDAAFINIENPTVPQQIGSLGIYDPSTAPGGFVRFKDVLRSFQRRLQQNPIFRTRLVEVPFGLDRPYWVLDPNFDVEFHIRHIALPKPGDWRQLCIQVARLHSRALDMSRPLWECYIIEGLDKIPEFLDCGEGDIGAIVLSPEVTPEVDKVSTVTGKWSIVAEFDAIEARATAMLHMLAQPPGSFASRARKPGNIGAIVVYA